MVITHVAELPFPRLAKCLERISKTTLFLAVVLVPPFFLPFLSDILELPKQSLLIVLIAISLVAWLGQALCVRRLTLARSWLHLVALVFLLGYGVVSWFSDDRFISFAGASGQAQWAFASVAAFVVMYFLFSQMVRGTAAIYNLLLAYAASSGLVGLLGLLFLLELLPGGKTLNSIGTPNSLALYLVIPMLLVASLMVAGCKNEVCVLGGARSRLAKIILWAAMGVFATVLILVDYWVAWVALLFGATLLVAISVIRARRIHHSLKFVVPVVLMALSIVFLLIRTPVTLNLPSEVSPSMVLSWNVARSALQEQPVFGSGPGTWVLDYAKYRSPAVNLTPFWNARFDRGISMFMTLLATLGLTGTALWLLIAISGIAKSARHLLTERDDDLWQAYLTVFVAWCTLVFIAFFYNYTFTYHLAFWFLLGLLASLVAKTAISWNPRESVVTSSFVSLIFLGVLVGGVSLLWLTGQRLTAEAYFSRALQSHRAGAPVEESLERIKTAATLNPLADNYARNLSQAYLLLASKELQTNRGAEMTKRMNAAVSESLEQAKRATSLSPANVDNWSNMAMMLQAIASFTKGADEQAIKMYQEALVREPNNPVFFNEIAKIHILRSDAYRQLLQSSEAVKREAMQNIAQELDKASEFLNQALSVKSDYAPAHYNLGLVYERQGRIKDAIVKMERVLEANSRDVGVAFQLAIMYYRNEEKDKALSVLEQIVAFDKNYINARWYLASMYEELGRYDDAIKQVQAALSLAPENQTIHDRLKDLIKTRDSRRKPKPAPLPEPVSEEIGAEAGNRLQYP